MFANCNYCLYEKTIIIKAIKKEYPNDFSTCLILLESDFDKEFRQFQEMPFNSNFKVIVGLAKTKFKFIIDHVLLSMKEGEKCKIICDLNVDEKYAGCDNINKTVLNFEFMITLFEINFSKVVYQLEPMVKLERTLKLKECGIIAFKNMDYSLAFFNFSRALKYILCSSTIKEFKEKLNKFSNKLGTIDECNIKNNGDTDISEKEILLQSQLYLNLAACQLKNESNITGSIENCNKALKIDKSLVKAWFRRGEAHLKLSDYKSALDDFTKALELDPKDKDIIKKLTKAKELNKQEVLLLANGLKNMFK